MRSRHRESWQLRAIVLSQCSAEPVFSVVVLFTTFGCTVFVWGLRQGIRTAVMIPSMSSLPDGWRLRCSDAGSNGSFPERGVSGDGGVRGLQTGLVGTNDRCATLIPN
jgi:hypothetical protein